MYHWPIFARAHNHTYVNLAGGPSGVSLRRLVISDVVRYLSAQRLYNDSAAFNAEIRCEEHN